MDKQIKRYADNGDLTSLKYIFVDSLDVDPTFESYEESYNYCKAIPGLLEQHMELTPLVNDPARWTETYWAKLKMDLKKNFSDQRMKHMRTVAKVLLAEKVQRLLKERQASSVPSPAAPVQSASFIPPASAAPKVRHAIPSKEAEQARELEREKRQLEAENRQVREEQEAKERTYRARAATLEKERQLSRNQQRTDGAFPKKAIGIAIAVVAAMVVLFLLLK